MTTSATAARLSHITRSTLFITTPGTSFIVLTLPTVCYAASSVGTGVKSR